MEYHAFIERTDLLLRALSTAALTYQSELFDSIEAKLVAHYDAHPEHHARMMRNRYAPEA